MGMDLYPIKPSPEAPRYPADYKYQPNQVICGRYNWTGWECLCEHLTKWDVDISTLAGTNNGDVIPESICSKIANAIESHLHELTTKEQEWLKPHIILWKTCGGYEQW